MIPRMTGLISLAISSKDFLRLCRLSPLIFCIILVLDFWLTQIQGMDLTFPVPFVLYALGRIVKPKKSNPFGYFAWEYPLRLTILLLSACNCNLHDSMRSFICRSINFA